MHCKWPYQPNLTDLFHVRTSDKVLLSKITLNVCSFFHLSQSDLTNCQPTFPSSVCAPVPCYYGNTSELAASRRTLEGRWFYWCHLGHLHHLVWHCLPFYNMMQDEVRAAAPQMLKDSSLWKVSRCCHVFPEQCIFIWEPEEKIEREEFRANLTRTVSPAKHRT